MYPASGNPSHVHGVIMGLLLVTPQRYSASERPRAPYASFRTLCKVWGSASQLRGVSVTAVALATACVVIFGTADFFGGLATRRSRVLAVVACSQLGGLVLVLALMPLLPGVASTGALLWGMASGVAGGLGVV